MNQEDKGLELQPEKQTSLVPSRDIIFYKAFLHHTSPADTVSSRLQAPSSRAVVCQPQACWIGRNTQSGPGPVALNLVQGKNAASVAPGGGKAFY